MNFGELAMVSWFYVADGLTGSDEQKSGAFFSSLLVPKFLIWSSVPKVDGGKIFTSQNLTCQAWLWWEGKHRTGKNMYCRIIDTSDIAVKK